jgi:nucleotide-binding universal stress UspA family protein
LKSGRGTDIFDKTKTMENILLAINATNISMPALDFACYLAKLTGSKVTAVFLENLVADEKPVMEKAYGTPYLDWEIDEKSPAFQEKKKLMEQNIELVKTSCENRGVRLTLHRDEGVPAKEVIAESRFADVIVVDAATSFKKVFEGTPTHFVKDLLKDAECPVIISPESFEGIDKIVFTYDGSASSVFAMKQFTHLFPQLDDKPVSVFHVNEEKVWKDDEKKMLSSWLQNHYSAIGFESASGDSTYELFAYLFMKKNIFIVMGAYGRSAFSRFFKKSHADILLKTITQPIFINHL